MLIPRAVLDEIVEGRVDLAFRTWRAPRVRAGTRMRTAVGLVEVLSVEPVELDTLSEQDARRAGSPSLDSLLSFLTGREGTPYRMEVRHAGADPREQLRRDDALDDAALDELRRRLNRLDAASRHGAWTLRVLALIADHPATNSAELAPRVGRERLPFKADVRKLKELGLTESLDVGYRLSPRGRAALAALSPGGRPAPPAPEAP
ncbi:hypothetical protein [Streptomyces sp. NBC_00467]|uniref:hypothetical protein n=1 Tax=Streptomyces sp. NBC_00467 TaxID=2975752 RepID=UPI002E17B5F8